jgi:transposase
MVTDLAPSDRLRELIHQSPRAFGKPRSTWTVALLAEVCFELGIVDHRVSPSTVWRELRRMDVRWGLAKLWLPSRDPQYALKKARRDRLIEVAAKHSDWVLGFEDEVWWSRLQRPRLRAWTDGPPVKVHVLKDDSNDPDPVAICCYGLLRNDTHKVMLRFAEGRPLGVTTLQFLKWLSEELEEEGKKRLIVVWDDASWHACAPVLAGLREHNRQVWKEGGVEIIHFELPSGSPWLNNIEPCYRHAKKAIIELDRKLTKQETVERVCEHFGCDLLPFLPGSAAADEGLVRV